MDGKRDKRNPLYTGRKKWEEEIISKIDKNVPESIDYKTKGTKKTKDSVGKKVKINTNYIYNLTSDTKEALDKYHVVGKMTKEALERNDTNIASSLIADMDALTERINNNYTSLVKYLLKVIRITDEMAEDGSNIFRALNNEESKGVYDSTLLGSSVRINSKVKMLSSLKDDIHNTIENLLNK